MTTQELEAKFNLIGDPIVRAVVKHLYDKDYDFCAFEEAESAKRVLSTSFCWENQILYFSFWYNLHDNLLHNSNYSFTPEELQQVQNAYPELFNADGSLKESEIKGVWRDVYDSSEQKAGEGLDLQKLSDGLERALANETEESLNKFFNEHPRQEVEDTKTDFNRNEIAWDILMHLITSPKFDGDKKVVDNAFELADEFIKHSHETNNNK